MALEVFSFVRGLERAQVVDDARQAHQITMRLGRVFVYDDILLEDLADCLLLNTSGGVKVGLQLANGGPEVDLGNVGLECCVARDVAPRVWQGGSRDRPERQ